MVEIGVADDHPVDVRNAALIKQWSEGPAFYIERRARPEVVNKQALIRLKSLIATDEHSEYLSLYFKNNPDFFKLNEVVPSRIYRHPENRLNLDWPEDLEMLNII